MPARMQAIVVSLCCAFVGGFGGGCAQPRADRAQVDIDTLEDEAFLGHLADLSLVTVEEAFRAMVILSEGEDAHQTFAQRQAWLKGRDIVRAAWGLEAGNYIDQGSVAFMVCKILRIRGGLSREIFGSWGLGDRRYAHRELVSRELLATRGTDYAPMTGGELVHLLGLADEFMADRGVYESEPMELEPRG